MATLAFTKTARTVRIGDHETRHTVTIAIAPTERHGATGLIAKFELLRLIASDPQFTVCSYSPFDILRISYTGSQWVAEAEVIVSDS